MDNELVSIIIPVFNREGTIVKAIDSALNQTYSNLEIIISDNNSTDNTVSVIKEKMSSDKRLKLFENDKNLGPVLNWQRCIDHTEGTIIKIIWSDDWIDLDWLEKSVHLLRDNKIAFVYSSAIIHFENSTRVVQNYESNDETITSHKYIHNVIYENNVPWSPGCILLRKNDLVESFFVDIPNDDRLDFSRYGAGNDLLLSIYNLEKYSFVKYVNSTKSHFLSHAKSFTTANKLDLYYDWAILFYLHKCGEYKYLDMFKSKLLLKKIISKSYSNIFKACPGTIKGIYLFRYIHLRLLNLLRIVYQYLTLHIY